MTETTSIVGKYDRIAQHILENVLHRKRWAASDRDAIAWEIGKAVQSETNKLQRNLTEARQEVGILTRRANKAGLQIDAEPKKRRRLSA